MKVIDIDKLLHSEGKRNPKVLYSGWLVYDMRQYDPTINSVLGREDLETYNTFFEENDLRVLLERKDYHSILKWAQLAYYKELVSAEMLERQQVQKK